ncbi:hypothetical protein SAMN04488096_10661 [Mesonia phycicola]|uniref:Serine aminopeptidase S33 domain-containing protein n=1 Tax=Mesonia phycicola TaxID=579105 RepID=A0A1M6FC03_9FLAO|nr:alpha/beta fold hydrolase [Mesonia phycicola]SHI95294.1 hypothetical protein SAMN04488096_10661 [Mesonia phycicola]
MKKILLLLFLVTNLCIAQTIEGDWYGELSIQNTKLPTVFHINKIDTDFSATMDSPSQNAYGIPLDSVSFIQNKLTITQKSIQIIYEAELQPDTTLVGTFKQRGYSIPLTLSKKVVVTEAPKRPQTPEAPFLYSSEEVHFTNKIDNINLYGTLTLPKGKEKFPAVVLISGSGPQNRNEEILGHQPFWVLADYLTNNGIAVLRYDDRGTAASEGNFSTATTYNFIDDAQAAVNYLKTRPEINSQKIGAIGHSEGGIIAPALASKNKVDYIVLLAGPGLRGDKILNQQRKKLEEIQGINALATAQRQAIFQEVYQEILDTTLTSNETKTKTLNIFKKHWGAMVSNTELEQINNQINSNWMKEFIRLDPTQFLTKVSCPVLALNGEKDIQVLAKENLDAITKSVKQSGAPITTKTYPNLNHLFQEATTGSVQEYGDIEQTTAPQVLQDITQWILEQANN